MNVIRSYGMVLSYTTSALLYAWIAMDVVKQSMIVIAYFASRSVLAVTVMQAQQTA